MKSLLQKINLLLALLLCFGQAVNAQSTTLFGASAWGSSIAWGSYEAGTFAVRNTSSIPMKITGIMTVVNPYNGTSCPSSINDHELWMTTTDMGTSPNVGSWTKVATHPFTGRTATGNNNSPQPPAVPWDYLFTGVNLEVPPGVTMRLAIAAQYNASGCLFWMPNGTMINGGISSANGMEMLVGANGIVNGYFGPMPTPATYTTYAFPGAIIFEPVGFPCDDTLDSVKVLAPEYVCPGRPFNVRAGVLPSNLIITGATHQWQYSDDGISWSNFTGSVNSPAGGLITDVITKPRWYRCAVTCSNTGLTVNTPVKKVDIYPFYYCYCINSVKDDKGSDIGNVTIMANSKLDTVLKKSSLVTGTGLPVYSNSGANRMYTGFHDSLGWPCLYRDSTYVFHVSQIFSGGTYEGGILHAYIDYDRDGVYNTINERIFVKKYDPTAAKPEVLQLTARVPADTNLSKLGPTGLRFVLSKDSVYVPCDSLPGKGEVEDYIIKICPPPCNSPVAGGIVVSTDSSMCKSYEYTVTDTTYPKDLSAFDRAWQMSGDNITWLNVMNSDNKDTLNRVFTGQRIYYRLRTICQPTRDTSYSPSTMINEKAKYKCYCYSKAIGGALLDTSDVGGMALAIYSNNSGGPHVLNPGARYPRTDRTEEDPIELFTDSLYEFNVYHTMPVIEHGDAKVTIFMDFNNNHEYDIPNERVYSGYTSIGNHTLVDKVFIPYHTITDVPTGMRIILNNNVGPNVPSDEACGPYISGETEDYMVIFRKKWRAGISETGVVNGYKIYPNPANGKFYVQFSSDSDAGDVKVKVSSVTGQLVKEVSYRHEGGMFYQEVDMSGNTAGVYFVELQVGGSKQIQKLVLQ